MPETEGLNRHGPPPRDRSADVPGQAHSATVWMGGVIALFAVLALVLFGTTRMNDSDASRANLNTEQGVTTGASPASPQRNPQ